MPSVTAMKALTAHNIVALREELRLTVQADPTGPFAWCRPAMISTDAAIETSMPKIGDLGRFNPGPLADNLHRAIALSDRALAQHEELLALEERTIMTFVDYRFAEITQPLNLAMAKVGLKASRAQAQAGAADADDTALEELDRAETAARNLKLVLHGTDGHPLNYGDRIKNLRTVHIDTVTHLYHRLFAVGVGLAHYNIKRMDPLKGWSRDSPRNLQDLVEWLRTAVWHYEGAIGRRIDFIHSFFLEADKIRMPGTLDIPSEFAEARDHVLQFRIPESMFLQPQTIVTDMSVALAFKENQTSFTEFYDAPEDKNQRSKFTMMDSWYRAKRQHLTLNGVIDVPPQPNRFIVESEDWTRPKLPLSGVPAVWMGEFRSSALETQALFGVRASGDWTITIDNDLRDVDGKRIPLHGLKLGGVYNTLWEVEDFVVSFRLQTWT